MLDFKLLNSQAFLNGELIFRAFLRKARKITCSFFFDYIGFWGALLLTKIRYNQEKSIKQISLIFHWIEYYLDPKRLSKFILSKRS